MYIFLFIFVIILVLFLIQCIWYSTSNIYNVSITGTKTDPNNTGTNTDTGTNSDANNTGTNTDADNTGTNTIGLENESTVGDKTINEKQCYNCLGNHKKVDRNKQFISKDINQRQRKKPRKHKRYKKPNNPFNGN